MDGIILVFSFDDEVSFQSLNYYIEMIEKFSNKTLSDIPCILVGNKCDVEERKVSTKDASEFAKLINKELLEVSSSSGKNLHQIFLNLIDKITQIRSETRIRNEKIKMKKENLRASYTLFSGEFLKDNQNLSSFLDNLRNTLQEKKEESTEENKENEEKVVNYFRFSFFVFNYFFILFFFYSLFKLLTKKRKRERES